MAVSLARRAASVVACTPPPPWPLSVDAPSAKMFTLVIPRAPGRVLLGLKRRGFGQGLFNGFGGKVEPSDASVAAAAARELTEESGLTPHNLRRRGTLTFHWQESPLPWEVAVYDVSRWSGEPCVSDEMEPRWFQEADVPYAQMWADDVHWWPLFLRGDAFEGTFYFRQETQLVAHHLEVVPEGRMVELEAPLSNATAEL